MSDIAAEKSKPKYSTFTNTIYLIKNMWKWNKKLFLLCALEIPATVIVPLLQIYLPKILIDSVTKNVSITELMINIGIPIVCIIFLNVFLKSASSMVTFEKTNYRLKYFQPFFGKALDTDYENIDGAAGQKKFVKAGMAIVSNDSPAEAIVGEIVSFFSNIIGFILYAGIVSNIHPLIVIFIIASSIINYFVGKYVNNFEHKNKDNLAPINRKLEYISEKTGDFKSAKDMRLYKMSPWFKNMYSTFLNQKVYFEKKNIRHRYFGNFIDGVLILFRDGITYGFLINSVVNKNMPIGDFVLYFGAVAGFSTWMSGIVKNLNQLNSYSLGICDLREYLEMEDKMNRGSGVELPAPYELPCDIELKNLYYKYPGAQDYAIKNLNLHIKKGEKIALVGVNGAGKTTLVKLICGLYTPAKGEIYINGKKSSFYNRDEYYTLFSVVFQDIYLLPVSIEENIALKEEDKIDNEKMDRVLNMSGLMEKVKKLPKGKKTLLIKSVYDDAIELSGGEMQKLMLSQALYKDAPIIMLDEPTAALDPIAENGIYQKYNELTKGRTSIFISHRLASTRFCDRIVLLDGGRIIEEGDHNSLMRENGKYREMFDAQSYYYKDNIGGEENA